MPIYPCWGYLYAYCEHCDSSMVLCISYRMKQLPWSDSLSYSISCSHFFDRSTKEHKQKRKHSLKRIVRKSNEWNRHEKENRSQHIVNVLMSSAQKNKLKCQFKVQIRCKRRDEKTRRVVLGIHWNKNTVSLSHLT